MGAIFSANLALVRLKALQLIYDGTALSILSMFLLGVLLYFDNRPDEAKPLFLRAQQLSGGDDEYLQGFLRKLVPGGAPADLALTGD